MKLDPARSCAKRRSLRTLALLLFLAAALATTASANSSWHWLTETRPVDILPYVVAITLLAEYLAIKWVNGIEGALRLLLLVCLANLASFLLPYALMFLPANWYPIEMSLNHTPSYVVGVVYLLLTLLAEIPILYAALRKRVKSKRKVLYSLVIVNAATTGVVALVERVLCRGAW